MTGATGMAMTLVTPMAGLCAFVCSSTAPPCLPCCRNLSFSAGTTVTQPTQTHEQLPTTGPTAVWRCSSSVLAAEAGL